MTRTTLKTISLLTLTMLLFATLATAEAPSITLSSDGTRLLGADGNPLVLRGANWGWWSCVEPGDARLMRDQGANLVRISFMWTKITKPGTDEIGGEGLTLLDSMCRWADEAGLWFVLDCQEPPGGCNPAPCCLDGKNLLWRGPIYQDQFVRMWTELTRRYRHHKRLLAYELMNEPVPPDGYTPAEYKTLCLRAIDAIRAEDPQRLIVVSGLGWSSAAQMTDDILMPCPRLIYTFHMYTPGEVTNEATSYPGKTRMASKWLGNSPEGWGATGDGDWQLLEKTFPAPENATHGVVMLRSDTNAGAAWFDDVKLTCDGAEVPIGPNTSFAAQDQEKGWKVERQTAGEFKWDAAEGHLEPGSLRISGTDSYNAWTAQTEFTARPGATYTIRCWVKTKAATGCTYPSVAWCADTNETVDRAWLEREMAPARAFGRRNHVPIYCGEFGCTQSNPDGSGVRWPRDVGEILSRWRIPWTYWNWRETTSRGSMGVWVMDGGHYVPQQPLADLLRQLWRPEQPK